VYGDNPRFACEPYREMAKGDSSNAAVVRLHGHTGTHVDAPRHFAPAGRTVDTLRPEELRFERVALVDVPATPGELVGPERLEPVADDLVDADILLLRTGAERWRGGDSYVSSNPGLAPDLAGWLRERAAGLRAVGMDSVSISSYRHREVGREAHRRFLAPEHGRPFLLVEDMALSEVDGRISQVWVLPMRILEADGAPCTVVGLVD